MNDPESHRAWVLTLLDQFEGRLVRYASRLLGGDEHTARDVVQHTFLRLCRASNRELENHVAAWLFTVCRNRVLDILRISGRESLLADFDETEHEGRISRPFWSGDPADALEHSELLQAIRQAVDELPPSQREAIWLFADGFRYREIASITNRTEGNVRIIVHRAIAKLRGHPALQCWMGEPDVRNGSTKPASVEHCIKERR